MPKTTYLIGVFHRVGVFLLAGVTASAGAQARSAPAARPTATTHPTGSRIPVVHGVVRTAFSLRYEDYKIGTGPLAEPNKVYHVLYTLYLPSTGQVIDSTDEHRTPVMKDGKQVMGADGKPVMGPPEPLVFPQGYHRLIPGFDEGFYGMHVGGKRRIFVPWQLGYGAQEIPARGDHPALPGKSDLVFDVELVAVTDMPPMPQRPPGMPPHPGATPEHPGAPAAPPQPK